MTENVISLDDFRPHDTDYVACIKCGKDWIAVIPTGCNAALECPQCGDAAGERVRTTDIAFFAKYMNAAKNKKDQNHRTMVILNAKRMGL